MNFTKTSKNWQRHAAFQKIGEAISLAGLNEQAWRDRNMQHEYEIRGRVIQDPQVSSRLFGPRMKSLQFERSSKVINK